MEPTSEINKLLKARIRMERKLKELDEKIAHIHFRLDEERRCMVRQCPLDLDDLPPEQP